MPVTDRGNYQSQRRGVEAPFVVDKNYLAFPKIQNKNVTGFFLYGRDGAWYYDSIQISKADGSDQVKPIAGLSDRVFFKLVAQPNGLESITISYLPGFNPYEGNKSGPVMLGASVLPVVGAFVSRPESYNYIYQNPSAQSEITLKKWIFENGSGRKPASYRDITVEPRIARLTTARPMSQNEIQEPLLNELKLRRSWIKNNNLDEAAFAQLSLALDGPCKP